jgi:hypothetical protein
VPRARTILKVVLTIAAVLVIAALGLSAYAVHTTRSIFEASAARSRTGLATHRQQFMDDQKIIAGLPLFAIRSGKRDAGPLIGPRVRWLLATSTGTSSVSTPYKMPDATVVEALGDRWANAGPETWAGLDFSWMAQLGDYDFWDVERNSVAPDPRFFWDPEPDSQDLWAWTKLRIAKGVHDGDMGTAARDVQELARLCFTAERVGTELAGVVIPGARTTGARTPGRADARSPGGLRDKQTNPTCCPRRARVHPARDSTLLRGRLRSDCGGTLRGVARWGARGTRAAPAAA